MDFGAVTCGNGEGRVCVNAVDVGGLDDAGLDARLWLIGQGRNRLEGFLAEVVAEKNRRSCSFDTANTLNAGSHQSIQRKGSSRIVYAASNSLTILHLLITVISRLRGRLSGVRLRTGSATMVVQSMSRRLRDGSPLVMLSS